MPDGEMQSVHIPSNNNDVSAVFREDVCQAAEQITLGQAALGVAGVSLVVLLTVSGLLPLVASSSLATNAVLGWLANLGSNALAGWLAGWAQRNAGRLLGKDDKTNQALLQEMAIDLQTTLEHNEDLADAITTLLEKTGAISTALEVLAEQSGAQTELIQMLRADLRRTNLIQGRLHHFLMQELDRFEDSIKTTVHEEHETTRDVIRDQARALRGLTPFVTYEEFFRPWMSGTKLFNHTLSIVGRSDKLEQLHQFVESPQYHIAILPGRGGIGKSKILQTFAQDFEKHHTNYELRFLSEGVSLSSNNVADLPPEPCVLVVDDAHRRSDTLPLLLAYVQQRPQTLKIILATRPQALDYLTSQLSQVGFDPCEVTSITELRELSRADAKTLARQVLGDGDDELADHLAAVTWDSPLITVVGGRLLAEQALPPQLLEQNEDFRAAVLSRFRDELIGKVSEQIDPILSRNLLNLIAAIGPIPVDHQPFLESAAEFLKSDRVEVARTLTIFEDAGVLLRRGYSLRITPDVLSDFLLHEACVTKGGRSTGYAEVVFEKFGSLYPAQMLNNLAELDWRIQKATNHETNILDEVWTSLRKEFAAGSNSVRIRILDMLRDVAYYQPKRVLELVEFAIEHPAPRQENEQGSQVLPPWDHEDVLHKLPELLRRIGYTLEYLPRCCDLLWVLGRDDNRPLNSTPEQPIRVLVDLAKYDINKPYASNRTVLRSVERWLRAPDAHDHVHSPLDILEPLLAKEGTSDYSDGRQIIMRPFFVTRDHTLAIRERALRQILHCTTSSDAKVVRRAVASLEAALRNPRGYFGTEVPEEYQAQWLPEQVEILNHLATLVAQTSDPLVHMRIREAVMWFAQYSRNEKLRQAAGEVIDSIPDTFAWRLTSVLVSGPFRWRVMERDNDTYEQRQQHWQAMLHAVSTEFLLQYPNPLEGTHALNQCLQNMQDNGVETHCYGFLHTLSTQAPEYAIEMSKAIVNAPEVPLTRDIGSLLFSVRHTDAQAALNIAQQVVDSGHIVLCRSLAYWGSNAAQSLQPADLNIVTKLLAHPDLLVRKFVLNSFTLMGHEHPRTTLELVLDLNIGSHTELANSLYAIFDAQYGIDPQMLSDEELRKLLHKLECIQDIEDYHISKFLSYAAERVPREMVKLLVTRIERYELENYASYRPLPYDFHHQFDGLEKSEQYKDILEDVLHRAIDATQWADWWLPDLFKAISLNFNSASLDVLREWVASGDKKKIEAVGLVLRGAPPSFVFSQEQFVIDLLERAYDISDECYQDVGTQLRLSAVTGSRQGTPGQPFPEDVAIRDQATAVLSRLSVSDPAYRFYAALVRHAETEIRDTILRDEELLD